MPEPLLRSEMTPDARPSVLIVDEDPEALSHMAGAFHDAGWDTTVAVGGAAAERWFATRAFDLMVTEILMEDKEGIELILSLKARRPAAPVVAVSAGGRLPAGQVLQLAESLGADASLGKPLCMDALLTLASALVRAARVPTTHA